ncbi:fatty acid desaturase family protein [Pseudohalocynthiibacter sp. F2068]|uniref:fatty acid desaturase family protein n=1 Tax=Pseudohalocynthiibacter sp. F2068 TaxID=2926418 RepID=UPI001FF1FD85|nr:fatty acid desaturase family protein [Pseudohalocynthiibacter sp. F2068]MCK0101176.1 fatty acid desaturase family protein [Pseudohalocynthiibacter sp. F2068]
MLASVFSNLFLIVAQVFALYLLADFIGGIFHWAEDTLGSAEAPIWGRLFVQPNEVHHDTPGQMLKIPWYINNITIVIAVLSVFAACWVLDALTWKVYVMGFFGAWNQQVHRFCHTPTARLPPAVKWLQRIGIIQNARHHWRHHTEPHLTNYCVLTPWVNPALDKIKFWRAMEQIFVPIFGAPRRPDL